MSWYSLSATTMKKKNLGGFISIFFISLILLLLLFIYFLSLLDLCVFIEPTNYVSRYRKMHTEHRNEMILIFLESFHSKNIFPRSSFRHHSTSKIKRREQNRKIPVLSSQKTKSFFFYILISIPKMCSHFMTN